MLCSYLRSSSINQHKLCEMRYLFEYVLGMKSPTGKKACLGTIFHKVMEVRSLSRIAEQNKETHFCDDQFGRLSIAEARDVDLILGKAFDHYKSIETHLTFEEVDLKTIRKWLTKTLAEYPKYDPVNLNIVEAELFFDFEIKKDWARYEAVVQGEKIEGNLRVKGTMDTVIDLGNNVYEMLDYKSGQYRTDFKTKEVKDLEYLKGDVQLLLYLIALKETYPDKNFIMTLFYINCGGMFSVAADDEMLERAWKMLEKEFKNITKNYNPSQLDSSHRDFRCKYLCPFSKPAAGASKSICNCMKESIRANGFTKSVNGEIDLKTFGKYASGGGRSNVET